MSADNLPSGIDPGPDGKTRYVGPRSANGIYERIDDLIAGSVPLQKLIGDIAKNGTQPTIRLVNDEEPPSPQPGTTVAAQAADFNPARTQIDWNVGQVDFAVDYGSQNATQILFHEYDHAWYDNQYKTISDFRRIYSPEMSVTLSDAKGHAATYTWTIYTQDKNGRVLINDDGLQGYQHMLIHDDLVAAYGSDQTGALSEALTGAQKTPGHDVSQDVDRYSSVRPVFSAATNAQKGRPSAPLGIERTTTVTPTPFPRGGSVTGRVLDVTPERVVMQLSYGNVAFEMNDLLGKTSDAAAFRDALRTAHEDDRPLAIRMHDGAIVAMDHGAAEVQPVSRVSDQASCARRAQ